jgi:hypothetical protein
LNITGKQFGVKVIRRPDCPNDAVQIITEDDGNWFDKGQPFDAGWIEDLIGSLRAAQAIAKVEYRPDGDQER